MTPLQIQILLHYHAYASDYPNLHPPAQQEAVAYFLNSGFLEKTELEENMAADTPNYRPTEKLHVYCDALCKVPEPRQKWVVGS